MRISQAANSAANRQEPQFPGEPAALQVAGLVVGDPTISPLITYPLLFTF